MLDAFRIVYFSKRRRPEKKFRFFWHFLNFFLISAPSSVTADTCELKLLTASGVDLPSMVCYIVGISRWLKQRNKGISPVSFAIETLR